MTQAETFWFLNTHITLRRPSHASEDGLSVAEHWMPYGDSPPLHVHHREDEIFHILEGRMRFRVGEADIVAEAGQSLVAPKGVPHSFRVESEGGARVLVMTPGEDFEGFLRDLSRPADAHALPEPQQPTPEMIAKVARAAERRHIRLLGPPLPA